MVSESEVNDPCKLISSDPVVVRFTSSELPSAALVKAMTPILLSGASTAFKS